jgi:hypothetical protein
LIKLAYVTSQEDDTINGKALIRNSKDLPLYTLHIAGENQGVYSTARL